MQGEVGRALRAPQQRAGRAGPHPRLQAGWSWGGRSCPAAEMLLLGGTAGFWVGRRARHLGRAGL